MVGGGGDGRLEQPRQLAIENERLKFFDGRALNGMKQQLQKCEEKCSQLAAQNAKLERKLLPSVGAVKRLRTSEERASSLAAKNAKLEVQVRELTGAM